MDLLQEKKIIQEAKKNPEAFAMLYDKYYKVIFGYILKRTADIEIAQDITSQTFFKALRDLGKFRWQNVPFSAWLYRIATNEINSFYRNKKKFINVGFDKIPDIASPDTPHKDIEMAEEELKKKKEFIKIHESISRLNPIYQTVITLRFFDKKKIYEISQILGKSEGTIKSQIHRGLEELRKIMSS
jgi:RNA polymerase sigma-70 factor (ECF subfamily)